MRERVNFNVRIHKQLREDFKSAVTKKGFSTCFIIETLIAAWLAGAPPNQKANPGASITVHQNIVYEVAKSRRRKGVRHAENCYLNGVWTFRMPEKGEKLSTLGHVPECECSACAPFVSKAHTSRSNRARW